jgi:hypothetical protein
MNMLRTLGVLTAFGALSGASAEALAAELGQSQEATPPAAGANERAAGAERQIAGDTKPKDKLVGLPVETAKGEQLGSVVDIVRDKAGKPTYAVVAIDTDTTAVPYDTAMKMVRDNKVIMSPTKLAAAPKVKQSEWLDQMHTGWRSESDRYWGNTRTASKDEKKKPAER